MSFWMLCFFSLVPFHHSAVHQANLTVCPDYTQLLHWGEVIQRFSPEAVPSNSEERSFQFSIEESPASSPESVSETEISGSVREIAENTSKETSRPHSSFASAGLLSVNGDPDEKNQSASAQHVISSLPQSRPGPLTISEKETVPLSGVIRSSGVSSSGVQLAAAEEMIVSKSSSESVNGSASEGDARQLSSVETETLIPVQRPWGALTFCVFLLLLSLSGNVFLGWQLAETRRMKMK